MVIEIAKEKKKTRIYYYHPNMLLSDANKTKETRVKQISKFCWA